MHLICFQPLHLLFWLRIVFFPSSLISLFTFDLFSHFSIPFLRRFGGFYEILQSVLQSCRMPEVHSKSYLLICYSAWRNWHSTETNKDFVTDFSGVQMPPCFCWFSSSLFTSNKILKSLILIRVIWYQILEQQIRSVILTFNTCIKQDFVLAGYSTINLHT